MNKEKEYHIEVYEDNDKKYVLLEDLQVVLEAGQKIHERIDKAIKYMRSQYTITDDDLYLALYSSDGTLDKLENILRGEEDDKDS